MQDILIVTLEQIEGIGALLINTGLLPTLNCIVSQY
jgi:hypothetical protein